MRVPSLTSEAVAGQSIWIYALTVLCPLPYDARARFFLVRLTVGLSRRQTLSPEGLMRRICILTLVMFLAVSAFAQSGEVAPNENLVAEGIPKIPASLAESVGR